MATLSPVHTSTESEPETASELCQVPPDPQTQSLTPKSHTLLLWGICVSVSAGQGPPTMLTPPPTTSTDATCDFHQCAGSTEAGSDLLPFPTAWQNNNRESTEHGTGWWQQERTPRGGVSPPLQSSRNHLLPLTGRQHPPSRGHIRLNPTCSSPQHSQFLS